MYISAITETDWPAVARIYQEGIDTGNATFAAHPPRSWEKWCAHKIDTCSLIARVQPVAGVDDWIVGWAALSPVSTRAVYAGVAEVSIYVRADARGQGIGALLLRALIERAEAASIWTLQAGVFPENQASLRLHLQQGFRRVGIREKLGKMAYGPHQGQWRDVVLLERRSKRVGI
jgi:L-amino acid N-acyltransferase YncA